MANKESTQTYLLGFVVGGSAVLVGGVVAWAGLYLFFQKGPDAINLPVIIIIGVVFLLTLDRGSDQTSRQYRRTERGGSQSGQPQSGRRRTAADNYRQKSFQCCRRETDLRRAGPRSGGRQQYRRGGVERQLQDDHSAQCSMGSMERCGLRQRQQRFNGAQQ